jgi:hypothetical protein
VFVEELRERLAGPGVPVPAVVELLAEPQRLVFPSLAVLLGLALEWGLEPLQLQKCLRLLHLGLQL